MTYSTFYKIKQNPHEHGKQKYQFPLFIDTRDDHFSNQQENDHRVFTEQINSLLNSSAHYSINLQNVQIMI